MQVKIIAEHSAILLTFIKLPFVIKIFVLSIFEWPLKTGFTVYIAAKIGNGLSSQGLIGIKGPEPNFGTYCLNIPNNFFSFEDFYCHNNSFLGLLDLHVSALIFCFIIIIYVNFLRLLIF